jgi:effector-binding domain-containing protein
VVTIQQRSASALIVTPAATLMDDTTYYAVLKKHYTTLDQQGIGRAMIHGMLMQPTRAEQPFDAYTYDYIYTRTDDTQQADLILPAGDYLVTHYRGDYHQLETAYQRLMRYARQHDYEVGPYISEAYLLDELAVVDLEDYLYELSVPIQAQ